MMKLKITALLLVVAFSASTQVLAGADDTKWIAQCMQDNKDEGADTKVVMKYCECMNNEMSENETRTITQWEKANPKTRKMCEQKAGWK
jgi:hypothetical protein